MRPQASIAEMFSLEAWSRWFAELDRGFVFLLVLPLVVAAVGLWAWYRDRDHD
jgi:hypothetical protein